MIKENVEIVDPMAWEHVGSICICFVALSYSIYVTSSCKKEERCDDGTELIHEPYSHSLEMCDALMEYGVNIDSIIKYYGTIIEDKAMDSRFS